MRSNCLEDSDDAMDETCVTHDIKEKDYYHSDNKGFIGK